MFRLVFESPSADVLDFPDNVTTSPGRGTLVVCEDGGDGNVALPLGATSLHVVGGTEGDSVRFVVAGGDGCAGAVQGVGGAIDADGHLAVSFASAGTYVTCVATASGAATYTDAAYTRAPHATVVVGALPPPPPPSPSRRM